MAWMATTHMMRQGRSWSGRERNVAFLNTGGERMADVSAVSGFDFLDDARAVARVDWDGDGDLDLVVSNRGAPRLRLLRNDTAAGGHFVAFQLEGKKSNRDAISRTIARVDASATSCSGTPAAIARWPAECAPVALSVLLRARCALARSL